MLPIATHVMAEGHAWIASGYRAREYQPHLFIEDLVALREQFLKEVGTPRWSIIYGQSMGGHIVTASLELRPGLYQGALSECGLVDGTVYHYWFEVADTNAYRPAGERRRILVTDPAATAVDWRLLAPRLPPPYGEDDRDPAAVVLFRGGRLVPCDPGGETVD